MQVFFFLFRCQKTVKVTHFERQRSNFDMMMMITILLLGDIFSDVYICCTYEGNSQRKQIKPDHSCVLTYVLYGDNFSEDQSTYWPHEATKVEHLICKPKLLPSLISVSILYSIIPLHSSVISISCGFLRRWSTIPCAESNLNNRQKCLFDRVLRNCVDNDDDHAFLKRINASRFMDHDGSEFGHKIWKYTKGIRKATKREHFALYLVQNFCLFYSGGVLHSMPYAWPFHSLPFGKKLAFSVLFPNCLIFPLWNLEGKRINRLR